MSYGSRTQYPSASRTRRGRGGSQRTPSYQPHMMGSPMADQSFQASQGEGEGEDELQYGRRQGPMGGTESRALKRHGQGAHYVLPPDRSKNSKLKNLASREEAEYTRHREEKREQLTQDLMQQSPKAVGGAKYTSRQLDSLREQQEKEQQIEAKFAKIRSKEKRDEFRRVQREREDAELEKKKQTQREKAIRLEARKQQQEDQEREKMRMKRLERFDTQRTYY